jgi:hypothetical protein
MALPRSLFKLYSPYNLLWTPDAEPDLSATNMPATMAPDDSDVLEAGEWLFIDSATGKAARAATTSLAHSGGTVTAGPASKVCYPLWYDKGRTDGIVGPRVPLIRTNGYEAETKMFLYATGTVSEVLGGADITEGMPLIVVKGAAESGGYSKFSLLAGLADPTKLDTGVAAWVIGYCTKVPADNNGFLRFVHAPTLWVGP